MKKILLAISALTLALGFSMPVYAATQTTTMPVSVTYVAAVTVFAGSLNFGSVPATLNSTNTATATITVNATNGLNYTVTLDGGTRGTTLGRYFSLGNFNYYELFKDASLTQAWGDSGFANTATYGTGLTGIGNGADQILTVYGKQWVDTTTLGIYSDTVTVTVNY